jgi:Na+/H+-dicarboxylate symporter
MNDQLGEYSDTEQHEAASALIENRVAGAMIPAFQPRSTPMAWVRPGVVQAGVMGLNGAVAWLVAGSHWAGLSPIGVLITLNLVLLAIFFLADRHLASMGALYSRRLRRLCIAGFVAAAIAALLEVFSTSASLVPLGVLSVGYLMVSMTGYFLRRQGSNRGDSV